MSLKENDIIREQLYEENADRPADDLWDEMPESVRSTIVIKNNNEDGYNDERIFEAYLEWRFDTLPDKIEEVA